MEKSLFKIRDVFFLFLYKSFAHYDKVGCFIVVRAYTNCFIAGYKVESDAIIQVLKNNWFTPFTNTIRKHDNANAYFQYDNWLFTKDSTRHVIAVTTHLAI